MRTILSLRFSITFTVLALLSLASKAANLWSGSCEIGNWGYMIVEASAFNDLSVGDKLNFSVTTIDSSVGYPQIMLKTPDDSWSQLSGAGSINLSAEGTCGYGVTTDMLTDLKTYGLVVSGCGYTLTSIDYVKGSGEHDYSNSVWIGNAVIGNWDSYAVIPGISFKNAKVGNTLRINVTDITSSSQGSLGYIDASWTWKDLPGTSIVSIAGTYYEFPITAEMLPILRADKGEQGLIVRGSYYTLVSVDVFDPASRPAFSYDAKITNNLVWEGTDIPQFTVGITSKNATSTTVTAVADIATDKGASVQKLTQSQEIAAGATVDVTLQPSAQLPAGVYKCTLLVNDELAGAYNFIINPKDIVSPVDAQEDFSQFWDAAKSQLANVEPEYELTLIPEKSTSDRNVYSVSMKSIPDDIASSVVIRGYYAEPVAEGSYPALIHYQGYDSTDADPWCMGGSDNPGFCEFTLSTRGQMINNRPPYENVYGDWVASGVASKESYYYRGAFMDAVRAIDFIASRSKVKQNCIFAEGSSQGGALTIAAAALDSRLRTIAPSIQFLGDFPDYFEIASWPAYPVKTACAAQGMTDDDMYKMLSYFDTKNLAPHITCPVLSTIGVQDPVCPPHTNLAPINNLSQVKDEDKVLTFNATLEHAVPNDWYVTYTEFFKNYITTSGVESFNKNATTSTKCTTEGLNIIVTDAVEGCMVNVYTLTGALVATDTATDGNVMITMPENGIYIVSASGNAFKVIVK